MSDLGWRGAKVTRARSADEAIRKVHDRAGNYAALPLPDLTPRQYELGPLTEEEFGSVVKGVKEGRL